LRRRRNAIEPIISHTKSDGHLGRNFLFGAGGDAANLILAAAGHNLRLLGAWPAWLSALLFSLGAPPGRFVTAAEPQATQSMPESCPTGSGAYQRPRLAK
jgi:IS5 family transposase